MAERGGLVLNPTNEALKNHAEKLLNFWRERSQELPSNEELANYLYAEETQTGGDYVTTVLVWLSRHCPLGRWFTNIFHITNFVIRDFILGPAKFVTRKRNS